MKNLVILTATLLLFGCAEKKNNSLEFIGPEWPSVVRNIAAADTVRSSSVSIKISYDLPGCFSFKRVEYKEVEGNLSGIVWIQQFKPTPGVACLPSTFVKEVVSTVNLSRIGDNFISFNDGKLVKKIIRL
jgi:hypothetical protein